jgi:hypothetical protein
MRAIGLAARRPPLPHGLSPLIWPANYRSAMGSDASRSVGTVGATNRTVVPITVMARIRLANSNSPIGSDAASPIDAIDTSGCVAWLGKHERAKCNHDGEHRDAISGEALCSVFHFCPFWMRGVRDYSTACW